MSGNAGDVVVTGLLFNFGGLIDFFLQTAVQQVDAPTKMVRDADSAYKDEPEYIEIELPGSTIRVRVEKAQGAALNDAQRAVVLQFFSNIAADPTNAAAMQFYQNESVPRFSYT